jgi:hypothetical protein
MKTETGGDSFQSQNNANNRRLSAGGSEMQGSVWQAIEEKRAKETETNTPDPGGHRRRHSRRFSAGGAEITRRDSMNLQLVQLVAKERDKLSTTGDVGSVVTSVAGGNWNLRLVWLEMRLQIKTAHYSPFMRVVLSYTQVVGLLGLIGEGALERSAAGRLMRQLDFLRYISLDFILEVFTMIDCSISQTMMGKTVVVMMVPLVLMICVALVTLLFKACVPKFGMGEFVRGCSFGLVVLYSSVVQKLFSNLARITIEGKDYAVHDTSVEFGTPSQTTLVIVSIAYALVYGLGIPAILLLGFRRGQKKAAARVKSHFFGFLVKGYKMEYYWWEYTVLSRRFVCCFIVSVCTLDAFLSSSLITIIFLVSLVVHMLCVPYSTSFLNLIELINLFCVLLSASANMVAFGTQHEEVIEYAAAIYIFAQILFAVSIITVIVVILFAATDRNKGRSIALTSLPAAFAKASATLSA